MSTRQLPDKFKVAFSLAGEQRNLVRRVAEAVEQELGRSYVFLDEWFEHYIAGDDAELKLQEIYGVKSALVVVCVSGDYGSKPWTQTEHAAIRARTMTARATGDERDKLAILPIRVGDGDVEGVLFNTIVPDIRERSVADAAQLIVDRLRLLVQVAEKQVPDQHQWPQKPPPLAWPMADHSDVRAAFKRLLTCTAPYRFLPVRGPSESGKSHITRQMLGNALRMSELACGRFDFKGTTDMDAEVRTFIQQLDVPLPSASPRLNERLSHILETLRVREFSSDQPTAGSTRSEQLGLATRLGGSAQPCGRRVAGAR